MSKQIKYEISHQAEQLHWESTEIPSMTSGLLIQADMPEKCRCMAFISGKGFRGSYQTSETSWPWRTEAGDWTDNKRNLYRWCPGDNSAGNMADWNRDIYGICCTDLGRKRRRTVYYNYGST